MASGCRQIGFGGLNLAMYHAVVSITIPVLLTELLFPQLAAWPWLSRAGRISFSLVLGINTIGVGLLAAFAFSAKAGYTHPPLVPFLAVCALMVFIFCIGSMVHITVPRPSPVRPAPRLWTVRLAAFGMAVGSLVLPALLIASHIPAWGAMLLMSSYYALCLWRVVSWSGRPGWQGTHRLAIASGIIGSLMTFGLLIEVATGYFGLVATVLVDVLAVFALSKFARVVMYRTTSMNTPIPVNVQ